MNLLGINCSVYEGRGKLIVIVCLENNEIHRFVFRSPSIFSFSKDSGEILNWHKENILSLISRFAIGGIVVKKTEHDSFTSRPKKSTIFKLYMEGVMLSLAGDYGVFNKHYYKNRIKFILEENEIFELPIERIFEKYNKTNCIRDIKSTEAKATKELLLAIIALEKETNNND